MSSAIRLGIRPVLQVTRHQVLRTGTTWPANTCRNFPPRQLIMQTRMLSFTTSKLAATTASVDSVHDTPPARPTLETGNAHKDHSAIIYTGPLASTFKRLKIFSISACVATTAFTPFLFVLESSLPLVARTVLCGTVLTTTFISAGLVGRTGAPYVNSLRRTEDGAGLEMSTSTMMLRPRTTTVYDPAFLVASKRPFTTWQLAHSVQLPPSPNMPAPGSEETVAETKNDKEEVTGRWIVTWGENGAGICTESGKILK